MIKFGPRDNNELTPSEQLQILEAMQEAEEYFDSLEALESDFNFEPED